jgi:hypothetical protein
MRNLILMAVAAVAFFVVGIANPKVLIAQDSIEADLESDRPFTRNRPDRGEDVQARQETFRNRAENLSDRRENRRVAKKDFQRYPEYRGDHRRDFRGHREFRRDQKRDFQAQRGIRGGHKHNYFSKPDRRNRHFAKRHRYAYSTRSYKGRGWSIAHRR